MNTELVEHLTFPLIVHTNPTAFITINTVLQMIQKLPGLNIRLYIRNNNEPNPDIAQIISNWKSIFFSRIE